MKKAEILKRITIDKLDSDTVFMQNKFFSFAYTRANSVVKDEYKDKYRYFGGLQCEYQQESPEYKLLEDWLCEIAEKTLNIN